MREINDSLSSPKENEKKMYTTPTLEKIGAVKDATRGSGLSGVDSLSQQDQFGNSPSAVG